MNSPDISFIVSAYNRPQLLPILLYSLKAQTVRDIEVIVTDNATDAKIAAMQRKAVRQMDDGRFRYIRTAEKIEYSDCYWSSEYGVKYGVAQGRWLCFPCDDCYYPDQWSRRMLTAGIAEDAELVLCEKSILGPETSCLNLYNVLTFNHAWPGCKASFIIRADCFSGWDQKPTESRVYSGVDRTNLCRWVKDLRTTVARDLIYWHN